MRICVGITFLVLLFGAITALPVPVADEIKFDHDLVKAVTSKGGVIDAPTLATTESSSPRKEETGTKESSVESNESKAEVSSEEHSNDENKEKSRSDKNTKNVSVHSSSKPKLNAAAGGMDKTRNDNRGNTAGLVSKVGGGKVITKPRQNVNVGGGGSSSQQNRHQHMIIEDASSYEKHKNQAHRLVQIPRRNGPRAGHQQQVTPHAPVRAQPNRNIEVIILEKMLKQQLEMQQILKQMAVRQAGMERTLYHIGRNFQAGTVDYRE